MRPRLHPLLAAPLLAGAASLTVAVHAGPAAVTCAAAAGLHHAALVVEHGDGATVTRCVAFSQASITGDQLLQLSGIEYATLDQGSYGKAVCQIDEEPATYPASCWTASSPYWALFVARHGGGWSPSSLGVSGQTFGDGDAEGFRYEPQDGGMNPPPSAAGVCGPAPTPAPTAGPTAAGSGAPPAATASGVAATMAAGGAGARSSPPGGTWVAPSAAASSPAATSPAGGVAGLTNPAAEATPGAGEGVAATGRRAAGGGGGASLTWALAFGVAGGLVGVLAVRLRRRRT